MGLGPHSRRVGFEMGLGSKQEKQFENGYNYLPLRLVNHIRAHLLIPLIGKYAR